MYVSRIDRYRLERTADYSSNVLELSLYLVPRAPLNLPVPRGVGGPRGKKTLVSLRKIARTMRATQLSLLTAPAGHRIVQNRGP